MKATHLHDTSDMPPVQRTAKRCPVAVQLLKLHHGPGKENRETTVRHTLKRLVSHCHVS